MMTKLYNPKTGEAIFSDKAAPWMGVAMTDAPVHDRQTSSAFYIDGAWSVVAYVPDKEELRQQLKATRDTALQATTHDFLDGRIAQVRPQDLANFQIAIANGVAREWVMADNSVAVLTVAEMQAAMQSGITQGEAVWDNYIAELKLL